MSFQFDRREVLRLAAFLAVILVSIFAVYKINERSVNNVRTINERGITNLRAVELRTCARVQYLRDQANGTNFLIYDVFRRSLTQQKEAVKAGHLKGAALKQAKEAIKRAQKVVSTTVVTGPTDCHAATFDNNYKAPAPEFIARNGPRVKLARQHADGIIRKAKLQQPLYDASKQPQPKS
jgi:hypothetical protein